VTKRKLTVAEVAYVLCGLRMLQNFIDTATPVCEALRNVEAYTIYIADRLDGGPTPDDLDVLCEAINLGEVEL